MALSDVKVRSANVPVADQDGGSVTTAGTSSSCICGSRARESP